MPLLLVFFLLIVCSPLPWPPPPRGLTPTGSLFATMLVFLGPVAAARVVARTTARRLLGHPYIRDSILRGYVRSRNRLPAWLMAAFVFALVALGWGESARQLMDPWPGGELLLLAPFVAAHLLCWAGYYSTDRLIAETAHAPGPPPRPFGSRRAYVLFHARQQFAIAGIPVAVLIIEQTLARGLPESLAGSFGRTTGLLAVGLMIVFVPWILRWTLNLRPLPAGPLRDRLTAAARRMRLRYSDLMVWDTRGGMANALITGLLPYPRYILFTDRLLAELTPDELVGVLGHEAGHVRHGHMAYYLTFFAVSLLGVAELGRWIDLLTAHWPMLATVRSALVDWEFVLVLAAFAGYLVVVFGAVSRLCERQADLAGCRAVSCGRAVCFDHGPDTTWPNVTPSLPLCPIGIRQFASALWKVGRLNGLERNRQPRWRAWRHDTIESRIAFLDAVAAAPEIDRAFQRRVKRARRLLLGALAVVVVGLMIANTLADALK